MCQRGTEPAGIRADRDRPHVSDQTLHLGVGETSESGEERPLIVVWGEGVRVDEDGRAAGAAFFLERQGDQVAQPFSGDGEVVLGGEESVVAVETETAAHGHRLT